MIVILLFITITLALAYKLLNMIYLARLRELRPEIWETLGEKGPIGLTQSLSSSNKIANHFQSKEFEKTEDERLRLLGKASNIIGVLALLGFFSFVLFTIYILICGQYS